MKRSEFVDLVNTIAQEERERIATVFREIEQNSTKPMVDMFAKAILQTAEVSARTTAKIIEQSGLIQFED